MTLTENSTQSNLLLEKLKELNRRNQAVEEYMRDNRLSYYYPHDKQKAFHAADKPIKLFFAGNRVGKTEACAVEAVRVLLGTHKLIPRGSVWSFCPSFDEQKDTTQQKVFKYLPPKEIKEIIWLRKGIAREIILNNGEKITFKSYEQGREKAQGAGKRLIWFDEEPPKDIYEECFVRQEAGKSLYIILSMTPVKGMTWIYDTLYTNTQNTDQFIVEAGWNDNPYLTEDQKEQMRRGLSKEALEVREKGKFMRRVGLVATWFDRNIHVRDIKELPDGDDYMGLDFGFSNPSCALWIRVDRENNWWVYDGFYKTGLTDTKIHELIVRKESNLNLVRRFGDSAQASSIQALNDLGIKIKGVTKQGSNKENWDEYRASLMERHALLNGKPKLFIASSLKDDDNNNFLVKELLNLVWEEKTTLSGETKQGARWAMCDTHAIDALTYVMAMVAQPKVKEHIDLEGLKSNAIRGINDPRNKNRLTFRR